MVSFPSPRPVAIQSLKRSVWPKIYFGGKMVERVLAQCEMQTSTSKIQTQVTVSIYYDDKH